MAEDHDRKMREILEGLAREGQKPRLLLHACCAPCSTSVLEQLAGHFRIAVFFFDPNIDPPEEYAFREKELKEFLRRYPFPEPVEFREAVYDPQQFYEAVRGLENEPERGRRCTACYRLRLRETAAEAASGGFEYMATTLTLSPQKDPVRLNRIGKNYPSIPTVAAEAHGVLWLPSDFKKRNGYLRSVEITRAYGMYRQNYCGCRFSRQEKRETGSLRQEDR